MCSPLSPTPGFRNLSAPTRPCSQVASWLASPRQYLNSRSGICTINDIVTLTLEGPSLKSFELHAPLVQVPQCTSMCLFLSRGSTLELATIFLISSLKQAVDLPSLLNVNRERLLLQGFWVELPPATQMGGQQPQHRRLLHRHLHLRKASHTRQRPRYIRDFLTCRRLQTVHTLVTMTDKHSTQEAISR